MMHCSNTRNLLNRRRRAALAAVGLGLLTSFLGACGDDEPSIRSLAPTTSTTLAQAHAVPGGGVSLGVRYAEPLRAGSKVVWFLTVSNNGESVKLTFSTGQRGEVVLLRADGSEAYRWSGDKSFIQSLASQELTTGNSLVYELTEADLDVPAGEYELVASVVSKPEVAPFRQKVAIQAS